MVRIVTRKLFVLVLCTCVYISGYNQLVPAGKELDVKSFFIVVISLLQRFYVALSSLNKWFTNILRFDINFFWQTTANNILYNLH